MFNNQNLWYNLNSKLKDFSWKKSLPQKTLDLFLPTMYFLNLQCKKNKTPEKPYYKIHGILLDIRELMIHHAKSNQKIAKLKTRL